MESAQLKAKLRPIWFVLLNQEGQAELPVKGIDLHKKLRSKLIQDAHTKRNIIVVSMQHPMPENIQDELRNFADVGCFDRIVKLRLATFVSFLAHPENLFWPKGEGS